MVSKDNILCKLKERGLTHLDAGYRKFPIIVQKDVLSSAGEPCWGAADMDLGALFLCEDMEPQIARETLLHELFHIAFDITGFAGDPVTDIISNRTNEELVVAATRGMLLLINLNPELFDLLHEKTETEESES